MLFHLAVEKNHPENYGWCQTCCWFGEFSRGKTCQTQLVSIGRTNPAERSVPTHWCQTEPPKTCPKSILDQKMIELSTHTLYGLGFLIKKPRNTSSTAVRGHHVSLSVDRGDPMTGGAFGSEGSKGTGPRAAAFSLGLSTDRCPGVPNGAQSIGREIRRDSMGLPGRTAEKRPGVRGGSMGRRI